MIWGTPRVRKPNRSRSQEYLGEPTRSQEDDDQTSRKLRVPYDGIMMH